MKLYLLRHGDAIEPGAPGYKESERPLTSKGVQRTRLLAHALRQMEIGFDGILSSPLRRARETAEIIARGSRQECKLRLSEDLAPGGDMAGLVHEVNAIRPAPETLLLVGHEPYLSGLTSLLCTGGAGLSLTFKKGALCRLQVEALSCGRCATLEWLLQPRLVGFKLPGRHRAE
jgi:phosphohistidine phosphatase